MGCGPQEEQLSSPHKRKPTWALASSESQPSAAGKLHSAAPTHHLHAPDIISQAP